MAVTGPTMGMLVDLLVDLLEGSNRIRFLMMCDLVKLEQQLPSQSDHFTQIFTLTTLLDQRGQVEDIWDPLLSMFPNRKGDIDKVRNAWNREAIGSEWRDTSGAVLGQDEATEALLGGARKRSSVPVLGHGIYEGSGLSVGTLCEKLANSQDITALATAAELGLEADRVRLIRFLANLITRAADADKVSASLHQVLLALVTDSLGTDRDSATAGPILISATYDWILEQRMAALDLDFTVLSHVLPSPGEGTSLSSGRLLAWRWKGGQVHSARLVRSRGYLPPEGSVLVYKLLGSPMFGQPKGPALADQPGLGGKMRCDRVVVEGTGEELDLAELDTVVITESDHLRLAQLLSNRETGIPDYIKGQIDHAGIVFMGYDLDTWHFRLVLQLLRSSKAAGARKGDPQSHAVVHRGSKDEAAWKVEERAWDQLGVWTVKCSTESFARKLGRARDAQR